MQYYYYHYYYYYTNYWNRKTRPTVEIIVGGWVVSFFRRIVGNQDNKYSDNVNCKMDKTMWNSKKKLDIVNIQECCLLVHWNIYHYIFSVNIVMVALCNRETIYIFMLWFVLLSSFFSSPNLSGRRLDVYHTLAHGVALVRI